MNLPINPSVELFRWGPIPGRLFYDSDFLPPIFEVYPWRFEGCWPATLFLFQNKRMVWINEFPALRAEGLRVFQRYMLPPKERRILREIWNKSIQNLQNFQLGLDVLDFTALSNSEFAKLWSDYYKLQTEFWITTIPAELGNYGSPSYLEAEIRQIVSSDEDVLHIMEQLTAPEKPSFYQEEEVALQESANLESHTKAYRWLKNSYAGAETLDENFFLERKQHLEPNLKTHIAEHREKVHTAKQRVIESFKLNQKIVAIAESLVEGIEWQDERKKHIFISIYYKALLLKEVARRYNQNPSDLEDMACWEIEAVLHNKGKWPQFIERKKGIALVMTPGTSLITGEPAEALWELFAEEKVHLSNHIQLLKGSIAAKGSAEIVRGRACIVLDPADSEHLQVGDILIAPMTSPEYVFAMKKAAAIVTDTGGLTSHAAIVSRELKKTCLVGCKIATQVFKTGDLLEIDVRRGTVRKVYAPSGSDEA